MSTQDVARAVERREDERFITGKGCFVDDVVRPGMLHAMVVRSAYACAAIRSVDVSAARSAPGVFAVLGPDELRDKLQPIPMSEFTRLQGQDRFLQKPLAVERTVYVGEPVAVVLAKSRYLAEDAAGLIEIDYEYLDPVVDMDVAVRDELLVHPAVGTNVASQDVVRKGDVEAAFARAAYVRKETFSVHRHTATPMETRGLVAEWDAEGRKMRVWGATKLTFKNREVLAKMLGLPETDVEMIEVDVGGGFGVRGEFYPEDFLIPYAAMHCGRPVKWIEDRAEHLVATNHSRQMQCTVEIAVDENGRILALRGDVMVDMGAYIRPNGGVAPGKCLQFMCGPYRIENAAFTLRTVLTNKTPFGSYRGPGRYESSYFRERIVDLAAKDLGIDPAEFRMRNLVRPEQMPWNAGAMVPGGPVAYYDTGDYPSVMRRALDEFSYESLASLRGKEVEGRLHGVGIGCFVESSGGGPSEAARLVVAENGRVHLYTGTSTMGQGHETVYAQILAGELGVPMDRIDVFHGSTTYVKKGWGTYHSRSAVMGGSAIVLASKKLREQVAGLLAKRRGIEPAALQWKEGALFIAETGRHIASLSDLAAEAATDPELREALEADAVYSSSELTYTFGVQLAHVAIDPETAFVEVLRFLTVEDVGRMLNPKIVHGQTIGASVQGLGGALLEHLVYDETGQLLSGSFADYLLPTATDFPYVEAISLELSPAVNNPLGVKGAGEGGIAAVAGAVANAVEDALRPLGVCIRDLPLSPDRISTLIRDASSCQRH
ncbi:xanthine dehydrogenase family protein molybdopterin-binding subunit [uncultured Pigmentiphaga sp.]|uniref:xanthine dehydrogenase family protein molybdopterin-binding subunit n=1 Tax=uncultured Pigmentiphaga sp. TaxID=340361 RepID=UPI0026142902|nr:xanthine dehydrogenase family protein molybdopterin-binding subunit [uncultured Pigmentiphaga sp.]